jgi:endogenous inhibitor of DNA gyrase (YacG/DUF329 family)
VAGPAHQRHGRPSSSPTDAIVGAAAGYLFLWATYWGFKLVTGKEGMGYGDFKLLGAIGAWLGWQVLPADDPGGRRGWACSTPLATFLTGRRGKAQPIPFGPFLAIAGWVCLLSVIRFWPVSGLSRSMTETPARIVKCPTCGKSVKWTPGNEFRPFCSERCKLIDLGAWASEQHRIPGREEQDEVLSGELQPSDDAG